MEEKSGCFYYCCLLVRKRGENGPTGYIIEKIDEGTCRFTWILNVDLKVIVQNELIEFSLRTCASGLVTAIFNQ